MVSTKVEQSLAKTNSTNPCTETLLPSLFMPRTQEEHGERNTLYWSIRRWEVEVDIHLWCTERIEYTEDKLINFLEPVITTSAERFHGWPLLRDEREDAVCIQYKPHFFSETLHRSLGLVFCRLQSNWMLLKSMWTKHYKEWSSPWHGSVAGLHTYYWTLLDEVSAR